MLVFFVPELVADLNSAHLIAGIQNIYFVPGARLSRCFLVLQQDIYGGAQV